MTDPLPESESDPGEWLFHPGHKKLYRPVETPGDGVVMLSVWHPEEVADARACDALVSADEVDFGQAEGVFDLVDSFRFLDEETVAAVREALDE
jgi:hypothetical protein